MVKSYILPYLRKGLARHIGEPDVEISSPIRAGFSVKMDLDLHPASEETGDPEKPANKTLKRDFLLAGPVDVQSVNERAVSQVVPADKSKGASYEFMPYIGFREEGFGWRYTPEGIRNGLLRPWLVLVACKEGEYTLSTDNRGFHQVNLQVETEEDFRSFFPTYDDFPLLAHAQINAPEGQDLNKYIQAHPESGVSRLFCHRPLEEDCLYTLFLLPAYELGRQAGLQNRKGLERVGLTTLSWGQDLSEQRQRGFTWPVYYQWTFTTGAARFETLASRLSFIKDADYKAMDSALDVDATKTGLVRAPLNDIIQVPAALVKNDYKESKLASEGEPGGNGINAELKSLLLKSPVFTRKGKTLSNEEDPWVVPPVYGARHVMAQPKDLDKSKGFLGELNLRFRNRAAAGMGASVVKRNQEVFTNRAWGQIERINALNQQIREVCEMAKMNDASLDKLSDKRYYTFGDELFGLQTDAAIRVANQQSSAAVNADAIAGQVTGDLNVSLSTMGNYTLSQGITKEELLALFERCTSLQNWEQLARLHPNVRLLKEWQGFYTRHPELKCLSFYLDAVGSNLIFDQEAKEVKVKSAEKGAFYFSGPLSFREKTGIWYWPGPLAQIEALRWAENDDDTVKNRSKLSFFQAEELCRHLKSVKYMFEAGPDSPRSDAYKGFITGYVKMIQGYMTDATISDPSTDPVTGDPIIFVHDPAYYSNFPDNKYKNGIGFKYWCEDESRTLYVMPFHRIHESKQQWLVYSSNGDALDQSLELQKTSTFFRPKLEDGSAVTWALHNGRNWFNINRIYEHLIGRAHFYRNLKTISDLMWSYYGKSSVVVFSSNTKGATISLSSNGKTYCTLNDFVGYKGNYSYADVLFTINGKAAGYYRTGDISQWTEPTDSVSQRTYRLSKIAKSFKECTEMIEWYDEHFWIPSFLTFKPDPSIPVLVANEIAEGDKLIEQINKDVKAQMDSLQADKEYFLSLLVPEKPEQKDESGQTVERKNPIDATEENRKRLVQIADKVAKGKMTLDILRDNFDGKYPIMAYPKFPDPTSFYLREISEKFLLPSVDALKMNTIASFMSNPVFEEAFLSGMNTEMARELLWREYPTDERGSYFCKFWDQAELPEDFGKGYFDVKPLHLWTKPLGKNHEEGKGNMIVFTIRSELMQIYPRTAICLSTLDKQGFNPYCWPEMTGWLTDDTFMAGFNRDQIRQTKGLYLTFIETDDSQRFLNAARKAKDTDSTAYALNRRYNASVWGQPVPEKYFSLS